MTVEFIPEISNPELTTDSRYGGDVMINIRSLLNDIDISPLFDGWRPKFRTQLLFRSGTIAMLDEDSSNEVHIYVDDIINKDGNVNLHIPAFTDDDDTIILQNHPQQINYKVLGESITVAADIDFNTNAILDATISGANNTISNISDTSLLQITDKGKLPSTAVYTDQANTFGVGFNQSFRHTRLLLWNPASTFRYIFNAGAITADRNVTIPLISADDTFALKGIDNVFTQSQTIQKATNSALLTLYNSTNTAGNDMLLGFDAQSSTGLRRTYAEIFGTIVTNTNGAENGTIYFNVMTNGTLGTKFAVNHNGYLYLGANTRVLLNDTGLSTQRIFTFPDVAGQLAVNNNANVFTDKQRITYTAGADALTLNRDSNTLGTLTGIYFKADDSANNETTYSWIWGGIGAASGDNTDGTENGQIAMGIKVAGSDVTKFQITKDTLTLTGLVPRITVGSGDFNSMYIYRPINLSGSALINFNLQNASSIEKTFGYVGGRSETLTASSEVGSIQFGAIENGTVQLQAKIHSFKTYFYNSSGLAAILDPTGLSSSRTYTFPDANGQITLNTVSQILTNKTVSSGWTITGDVTVNNALGLHITKNAGSSVAEVLAHFDVADGGNSYFQINNATTLDNQFVPRITSYNAAAASNQSGLYIYTNILGANDTGTTNGVLVLDSRRSDGSALTSRPILDVRNASTNLFRVFPTYVVSHLPVTISPTSGTGDFETLMTLQPSDSPSCSMVLQNGTSTNTVFTPLLVTQVLAAASASTHTNVYFRNIILAANDTGSIPLMSVEGRRSDATAITTRPIFSIKNLNTDLYLFYPTHLDLTNHFIEIEEIAAPSNPPANHLRIWMDNGDETLKIKNSAGTVTTVGTGGATAIDQLTDVDTSTTPPTDNQVLTWNNSSSQWVPATPPGAGGGEANLGANVGSGTGLLFRDKTGVTLNFKSILAGNGISVTNNTNDVTLALGTSITLPAAVGSMITFTKPNSGASGAERLMRWVVDDDPNGSELTIENLTGNQNIFAPGFIFSQYSTAIIPSAIILGRIADANDVVNTTPAISLNGRRPTGAIANRPIFGIQNYTDAYDFMVYKDKIDFGGNSLQNGVVSSSITGIVDANIDSHTSTKITISAKGQLPSTIAYEDEANVFTAIQKVSVNTQYPLTISKPINTQFTSVGIAFNMLDSNSAEQTYAGIWTSLEDNAAASKDSYIGFSYAINNTITRRAAFYNNSLYLGVAGNLAMITTSGLTADRTFTFPNLSGQLATQENANIFTAAQTIAAGVGYPIVLYRNTTSTGLGVAISFDLDNSNNAQRQYAAIVGNVLVSTAGAESGVLNFQTKNAGTLGTRMQLHSSGNLAIGSDLRLILTQSGLTTSRVISFPDSDQTLLGRTDAATVINKTVNTSDNSLTATSQQVGDILVNNGTKFVRKGKGTGLQVLRTNSGATDLEWASLDSERTGKAVGDGGATEYIIAHGLGSTPSYAFIDCSTHSTGRTWTVDNTNITVTFDSTLAGGTNAVNIYWRVIA